MAVKKCSVQETTYKKSIFGLRMSTQILCLLLGACCLAVTSAADTQISCANVKSIFEKKGMLSSVDIQTQPNSDIDGICLNKGCCGGAARSRLTGLARAQFEGALRAELNKLADMLANKASRFDEFFRKLLKLSREEFHSMFKRTYGMIYEQHSYVFEQLFEQLERYYSRGDSDFSTMMDGFFGVLYEKMFTVLNSQYDFDSAYLKCVSENMRDIQPFEDVPNKLTMQLKRAVVATRTFHKALRAGADLVRDMIQVDISAECVNAWTRLQYCGVCGGAAPPACSRYCHNVARGCLAVHADLADAWDSYVEAVDKVADRLLGPFNIAMVVEPIDIKISEAIMSFQEHNQEISQKIFAGCGKPVLGGAGGAGPFAAGGGGGGGGKVRRAAPAVDDDLDDFSIEGSLESLRSGGATHAAAMEQMRAELEGFASRGRVRARLLAYLRGQLPRADYEALRSRARRDAAPADHPPPDIDFKAYDFDGKKGPRNKKPQTTADEGHGSEWGGPALERLVRETRARVRASKRFWSQLPALLCTPLSVPTQPCFNGTHLASYTLAAAGEGSAGAASNPEVRAGGGGGAGGGEARVHVDTLRALAAHLRDAYNGQEVRWPGTHRAQVDQSLSASGLEEYVDEVEQGSGSGDGAYDGDGRGPPADDEDADDGDGSGEFPPEEGEIEPPSSEAPRQAGAPRILEPPVGGEADGAPRSIDVAPPPAVEAGAAPGPPPPVEAVSGGVSLGAALFHTALPVVCAWFGATLTDLF